MNGLREHKPKTTNSASRNAKPTTDTDYETCGRHITHLPAGGR